MSQPRKPSEFPSTTSPASTPAPTSVESENVDKQNAPNKEISAGFKMLFALDDKHLFRIVVDGHQQATGGFWKYEQREPGSIQNVLQAILNGQEMDLEDITVDFIKATHRTCRDRLVLRSDEVPAGQFILHNLHGFDIYNVTVDGLNDLCDFAEKYPSINPQFQMYQPSDAGIKKLPMPITRENIADHLQRIRMKQSREGPTDQNPIFKFIFIVDVSPEKSQEIAEHLVQQLHHSIALAKNDSDIIRAIVSFIYDFEHLHPFGDVNLRTNIVMADIILMQNGFPPVSYFDPNDLDACSKEEFFNIIKNGMLQTLEMIKNPNAPYFGFDSSTHTQQIEYKEIIKPIVQARHGAEFKMTAAELQAVEQRVRSLDTYSPSKEVLNEHQFQREGSLLFTKIDNRKIMRQLNKVREKKREAPALQKFLSPELYNELIEIFCDLDPKNFSRTVDEIVNFMNKNRLILDSFHIQTKETVGTMIHTFSSQIFNEVVSFYRANPQNTGVVNIGGSRLLFQNSLPSSETKTGPSREVDSEGKPSVERPSNSSETTSTSTSTSTNQTIFHFRQKK